MKDRIVSLVSKLTGIDKEKIVLEVPKNLEMGDYAFPCFSLAKEMKKNPVQIAKDIAGKVKSEDIERVEAVGPYVNFFVNKNSVASETISKILKEKESYGQLKKKKETVMIEFSQANTHKSFHVGHIRGTSLGESISRINEFAGNKVVRANYQGDTGMHVAKWIWCYLKFHKKEKVEENEAWFARIYVEAVKRLGEKPELQKEVDEINKKLEEKSDKELVRLWKETRKVCLKSLEKIYIELNTKFDEYFFESEVEKRGKEIAYELVKKNIAKVSEGAVIIDFKDFGLPELSVWVLLRKDGTVLYSAKDIALAERKFKEYKIDKAVYVVGAEQNLHIRQLFKTLELMKMSQADKFQYVPVSLVRLPTGKMSSRTGDNILYSDFRKDIVDFSIKEIKEREKVEENEAKKRALAISIASMKYSMLKQDPNKTIVFDKKEAMKFEGDTGPYLLYTYARARSVLRKAEYAPEKFKISKLEESENKVIVQLSKFPEAVETAYNQLSPDTLAHYTYELARSFNEFYHAVQVIESENEKFRLALVDAVCQTMKNSLFLLGINAIERM